MNWQSWETSCLPWQSSDKQLEKKTKNFHPFAHCSQFFFLPPSKIHLEFIRSYILFICIHITHTVYCHCGQIQDWNVFLSHPTSHFVLQKSSSIDEFGTINWRLALCLLLSWIIVGGALIKGVQSLGKVGRWEGIYLVFCLTSSSYTNIFLKLDQECLWQALSIYTEILDWL